MKISDLLFPPALYCNICGNLIDESRTYRLCDHCTIHVKWDLEPATKRKTDCGNEFEILRCAEYGIYERSMIFSLKYQGNKYIARDIAEIIFDRLKQAGKADEFDVIIPVPLSKEKKERRGFNHAELIGKYLARLSGAELCADVLMRIIDTRPMRGLSPEERKENIEGAFAIDREKSTRLKNKKLLLLDDFYTTGATANACIDQIAQAEAQSVLFIALAAKY